ncbi:MAG: polyprenyl synthetase family protein [Thermodesulfobacteriota bacterium]
MTPTNADTSFDLEGYLADARKLALDEIRRVVPARGRACAALYDLIFEYPLRDAKGLRPALCIATCRALGGTVESALPSASALELYHNAFLIHDDVEDGSETRRGRDALHRAHGVPIAVNVGDAMLALALEPLLDNTRVLGLGKALRILQLVARMARESAEGQAMELDWIRRRRWDLADADYVRMVYKKTSWYTFIAPVLVGAIAAGADAGRLVRLRKFASLLGIAFQIQDDILNLVGEGARYGKEIGGDLWEGKHTLILMHALRVASADERERAQAILAKERPSLADLAGQHGEDARLHDLLARLEASGDLTASGRRAIEAGRSARRRDLRSEPEVRALAELIRRRGSIEYASRVARRYAERARAALAAFDDVPPSVHRSFLDGLVEYVVRRDH